MRPSPTLNAARGPGWRAKSSRRSNVSNLRQERDFCRRRLARRNRLRDDICTQRPEIGDHHAREMAAKAPFVLQVLTSRFRRTGWWRQ
jgi:hypothetical protein